MSVMPCGHCRRTRPHYQHLYIEVQVYSPLLGDLQHIHVVGGRKQVEQERHDGALDLVQHGFDLLHSEHQPVLLVAAAMCHRWPHELHAADEREQTRTTSLLGVSRSHAHHDMSTCWLRLEVS